MRKHPFIKSIRSEPVFTVCGKEVSTVGGAEVAATDAGDLAQAAAWGTIREWTGVNAALTADLMDTVRRMTQ